MATIGRSAAAPGRNSPRAGNVANAAGTGFVAGLGRLLPQGDVRVVAPPFGSGDARIKTLAVKEGARVEQGTIIAVLDNEASLKAALAASEATIASREAALRQAKDVALASRGEARASLARAESAAVNAKREFDRVVELRNKGFAAEASFDAKRAAHEQAVQDVERATATLSRFLFDRVEDQPDIVVAQRALEAARVEMERSRIELDKAFVRAPITGTILTIHVRPGEKPGSQGIVNLGDIDEMTAEIEVYQTLIGRVAVGAEVTIQADALPQPLRGSVTRLGYEVKRQTATDATPAANTDARVVIVYVALAPESADIARRFTNLQVTARIVASAP
jgi:HlyD family secretion protein